MSVVGIRRWGAARRPRRKGGIAAVALCLAVAFPALAQDAAPDASQPLPPSEEVTPVTGEELRAEVPGGTLTGRHDNGMPYSEYHSPDGRIFGHNNYEPVRDGCWAIRGDSICYSYESGQAPGLFCWRFFRSKAGFRILLPESGTRGTATLERGNPENFSDGGKPWTCQSLMSMR